MILISNILWIIVLYVLYIYEGKSLLYVIYKLLNCITLILYINQ